MHYIAARALLALSLLVSSVSTYAAPSVEPARRIRNPEIITLGYQRSAWYMACEVKKYDCTLLSPPLVTYAIIPGILGLYPIGAPVVIINLDLIDNEEQIAVLIHEMIHYIQDAQGYRGTVRGRFIGRCAREQEAFTLTLAVLRKYNIASRYAVPWSEIREQYGCDAVGIMR